MAETFTDRFGFRVYGAGTDTFSRTEFNEYFDTLEELAAIDQQGTAAAQQALPAGYAGRYFWTTDTEEHFRDDGDDWFQLPTYAAAGIWTSPQTIQSDDTDQLLVETASNTGAGQAVVRRRTAGDGSTYTEGLLESTANVVRLRPRKNSTSGIGNDFSGMEGRWAINWDSDTAPSETLIVKAKGGTEIARFTEGGFVGIGLTSPIRPLDVRSPATQTPVARFGGPTGVTQEYALTMTPMGTGRMLFAFGADVSGSTHTARATSAGQLDVDRNTLSFYGNASLTAGNTYTPTKRFEVDSSGRGNVEEMRVGPFSLTGSGRHIRLYADPSVNTNYIVSSQQGSQANLALQTTGTGAGISVWPDGQKAVDIFKNGGKLFAAFPSWIVAGAALAVADDQDGIQFPGFRLVRFTDIVGGDGTIHTAHGLGLGADYFLLAQAVVHGVGGAEGVAMTFDAWDGTNVHFHAPNTGYAGRRVTGALVYAASKVIWS